MSRYKIRLQPGSIVLFFAALVIAYLTVVPLAMLVYGSFKSSPPGVARGILRWIIMPCFSSVPR
jgi:Sec-independent protein secretion pathway component TatC